MFYVESKVVLVIIIFLPSFTLCIFFPLGNIRNFWRDYTLQSTVPWLLIKSFEKSGYCWKVFKMHTFSVLSTQKVLNMVFFNFFPWDYPMGALPIELHPMGKWMAFLMSACLPNSNAVKILKIWQVLTPSPTFT